MQPHQHHRPLDPTRPRLSGPQRTRLRLAQKDLIAAREADLALMQPAALVLLVERLRGALDDALRLAAELSAEADSA